MFVMLYGNIIQDVSYIS